MRGFLFTTFEGVFLRNALYNFELAEVHAAKAQIAEEIGIIRA
jgi:hypothetical protein